MALYRSPLTVTLWLSSSFLKEYGPMIPPAHKAHQTVSFSGCNGVSTYTCGHQLHPNAAVLSADVAIQPEVRFITKQKNSLMKIGNNGNSLAHSTNLAFLDDRFDELPNQNWRINHLTAVKSVAILESNANLNFYT
ncbi:hypothetical protein TNCV_4956641 [Trichonephila clavipes]|nr:hypothetical protein TNCV_4956641 [Trichonephila clavipes]